MNPNLGNKIEKLKILPIRNMVIYPFQLAPIIVTSPSSLQLIDDCLTENSVLGLFTLKKNDKDEDNQNPEPTSFYSVGVVAKVVKMIKLPNNSMRVLIKGLNRCKITSFVETKKNYLMGNVKILHDVIKNTNNEIALLRNVRNLFKEVISYMPNFNEELEIIIANISEPDKLIDLIASNLNISISEKQKLLETLEVKKRAEIINIHLNEELELLKLGSKIQTNVKSKLDKKQREFFLRQELEAIKKELGESDEVGEEIQDFQKKIEEAKLPKEVKAVAEKELKRMSKMQVGYAEYSVIHTYLEWLTDLPWAIETKDNLNLEQAKKQLDKDHYDLNDVKEVILDFLAVKALKKDVKTNILCLVGPPGVGKTSLGRSIATSLNRKFVRMSLGGITDEAEIRGHRKTYVGALPGRIIQSIKTAGSKNPIFMLDEIDKLGHSYKGDPSSALLEVLDPEQNFSFRDNYLEVNFNLSQVMFIATANVLDTVPRPLLDRMEVVHIPGYTTEEKMMIGKRFLIPKQLKENGLKRSQLMLSNAVMKKLIMNYTREAGVRNFERVIRKLCRKIARKIIENKKYNPKLTEKDLTTYLKQPPFFNDIKERIKLPGIATGLAWTAAGGVILFIEATKMKGKGTLTLTGQLGDVMKESATLALTYIRANASKWNIDEKIFKDYSIHIHVPEGATPKDGPSAGITIATALFSMLINKSVRGDFAMTGELTLRGKVLPIGGVKEKILAAKQAGIYNIILPIDNKKDILDIDEKKLKSLKIHYVEYIDEVFKLVVKNK